MRQSRFDEPAGGHRGDALHAIIKTKHLHSILGSYLLWLFEYEQHRELCDGHSEVHVLSISLRRRRAQKKMKVSGTKVVNVRTINGYGNSCTEKPKEIGTEYS